jgi:hypothetical protein
VDPSIGGGRRNVVLELRPARLLPHARAGGVFGSALNVESVVTVQVVEQVVDPDAGRTKLGSEVRQSSPTDDHFFRLFA